MEFSENGVVCRQNNDNEPNVWIDNASYILAEYCQREYLPLPNRELAKRFYLDILQTIPVTTVQIPWDQVQLWFSEKAGCSSPNLVIQNTA